MSGRRLPTTGRYEVGGGHAYRIDGESALGVTTIIGDAIPKPALVGWAARMVAEFVFDRIDLDDPDVRPLLDELDLLGAEKPPPRYLNLSPGTPEFLRWVLAGAPYRDRDAAARRGTEVHDLAADYLRGVEVAVPEELAGHVEGYVRFVEAWQPRDELVERVVVNRAVGYAGTFDLIATLADGARWLLDIKTTRSGVFDEVALQLAGYRYAEAYLDDDGAEFPMERVDRTGVVWLHSGGFELFPVSVGVPQWLAFQRARAMAEYLRGPGRDLVGKPLTAPRVEVAP